MSIYRKKMKLEAKRDGVCTICFLHKARERFSTCERCAKTAREAARALYRKIQSGEITGRCHRCRRLSESKRCANCVTSGRKFAKAWYHKNKKEISEKNKIKYAAAKKELERLREFEASVRAKDQ